MNLVRRCGGGYMMMTRWWLRQTRVGKKDRASCFLLTRSRRGALYNNGGGNSTVHGQLRKRRSRGKVKRHGHETAPT